MAQRSTFKLTSLGGGVQVDGPIFPLDMYTAPQEVSFQAVAGAPAATYTVQFTIDDVFAKDFNPATATWWPFTDLTGDTTTQFVSILGVTAPVAHPVSAIRVILTTASAAGSATFTLVQSGGGN